MKSGLIVLLAPVLARIPLILADVAVLVITWRTQHSTWKLMKTLPKTNYLTRVFLYNGESQMIDIFCILTFIRNTIFHVSVLV